MCDTSCTTTCLIPKRTSPFAEGHKTPTHTQTQEGNHFLTGHFSFSCSECGFSTPRAHDTSAVKQLGKGATPTTHSIFFLLRFAGSTGASTSHCGTNGLENSTIDRHCRALLCVFFGGGADHPRTPEKLKKKIEENSHTQTQRCTHTQTQTHECVGVRTKDLFSRTQHNTTPGERERDNKKTFRTLFSSQNWALDLLRSFLRAGACVCFRPSAFLGCFFPFSFPLVFSRSFLLCLLAAAAAERERCFFFVVFGCSTFLPFA